MTEEQIALEAARAATDLLRERSSPGIVRRKGPADLVTEYDERAEAVIREVLARHTPDVPVLGEEGGGDAQATTRWVVDPIDGTTNFVHGFPYYAISIALEVDGESVAGVVVDVARQVTFRAAKGRGAFANDQPMRVSDVRTLDDALCATGFAYDRRQRAAFYLRFVRDALERTQGIRRGGAAALDLAYTAAGNLDIYWEFSLKPWDVAAGVLLVREAGGRVSPIPGRASVTDPLAANPWLHDAWSERMQRVSEEAE